MRIGEVCLMTQDVVRLAEFYKWLLGVRNDNCDAGHQVIIDDETMLAVCFDESVGVNRGGISLAFTVDDVDAEYERLHNHYTILISCKGTNKRANNQMYLSFFPSEAV